MRKTTSTYPICNMPIEWTFSDPAWFAFAWFITISVVSMQIKSNHYQKVINNALCPKNIHIFFKQTYYLHRRITETRMVSSPETSIISLRGRVRGMLLLWSCGACVAADAVIKKVQPSTTTVATYLYLPAYKCITILFRLLEFWRLNDWPLITNMSCTSAGIYFPHFMVLLIVSACRAGKLFL